MKKTITILILLFLLLTTVQAQEECPVRAPREPQPWDKHCYYGISFEKSENRNWGYGELIITDVEVNSPAEAVGIKVNDIIMEINGRATFLRDNVTIAEWLFDNPVPAVNFTIRNVNTYFKEYTLDRECITVNSVDEHYLSTIFSFYSLENSRQQSFKLPLKVTPMDMYPEVEANYTDYHTFGFYDDKKDAPAVDAKMKEILTKELTELGLTMDKKNPDIWINLHYEYSKNPLFTGLDTITKNPTSVRFDTKTKQIVKLPIYNSYDHLSMETKGEYVAQLGFTFFDKKYIDSTKYTPIWECSMKEYLSSNLTLDKYAEINIPLMMMQYPYSNKKTESEYFVSFSKYNYTGLHFDADTMNLINDIDPNSPAFAAGLRPGYRINKINGRNFSYSKDEITEGYRLFIENTEKYRNPETQFEGVEGYKNCMFWDVGYYSDVAKQFKKSEYKAAFSYLYEFNKYVNSGYKGSLTVEAWDGVRKRIFTVRPQVRESTTIKAFP